MGMKTKLLIAGVVAVGAYFYFSSDDEPPADTSFNDAYVLEDGSIVAISASTPERVRVRHINNGKIQAFYHHGTNRFDVTNGFSNKEVIAKGEFLYSNDGKVIGATLVDEGKSKVIERLPLKHEDISFQSGDLKLRGKLSLPDGEGPFPVVIMIHGSEDYSAVEYYSLPYMLAANGLAAFKFDKRGTGASEGEYTQHFPTLVGDVVAAINKLKKREDIDPGKINLAGFSQGGWIAPLVAKEADIQSIMVGFGTVVELYKEDRWGYVKQLQDKGHGAEELAKADELNKILQSLIDNPTDEAWDSLFSLNDKYRDEKWFKDIAGSDSVLGQVAERALSSSYSFIPEFVWKAYFRYRSNNKGDNFNRLYDPMTTMRTINTPSLWLLAGEDSSLPTPETVTLLDELKQQGKPVTYKVYPGAEHGNVLFELDENGQKVYTQYVDTYFTDTIEWFKSQN
ncbi:MAG: alpha/beta fold hydrolase [Gammaproteobacteria bacterium]|nr:alpha/beta fold hydrolase [Gammaproteobacteria bacterium]